MNQLATTKFNFSLLNSMLVNQLMKFSLVRNGLLPQFDTNRDGLLNTLSELNGAKNALNDIIKSLSGSLVTVSGNKQGLAAGGGIKTFKLAEDLEVTLLNFSQGDRVDIPSFEASDVTIDAGVYGDGNLSLAVVNDGTTNQINLTGVFSVDKAGITYAQLETALGSGFLF